MARQPKKTIEQVVAEVGRYPIEAYQFVREGLSFTVDKVHGKEKPAQRKVHDWMVEQGLSLDDLRNQMEEEGLPEPIARQIEKLGGVEGLNRHVSGKDLSWGLHDYALKKYGLLAGAVLRRWNINCTEDFGRIVFALVENDFMQKEPEDTIEDFRDVYDFRRAFEEGFKINLGES